jgi:hypothetical protein
MIISLHVPKTGGETFRDCLEAAFGPRLLRDYGDRVGFLSDAIVRHRRQRAQEMLEARGDIEQRYDIIHGHFRADKYRGLFRAEQYVAFFRDPMQQAISHYKYLRRIPLQTEPAIRDAQAPELTFVDFLARESVTNSQAELVGSVPLERFTMVALAEEFDRGVALFNATFGCALETGVPTNVDPDTAGRPHVLSPEERRAVRTYRQADFEVYHQARRIFRRLCAARGL